jgi:hypothetical protein
VTPAEASAALLTPADVGKHFVKAQFQPGDDPLPCTPDDPPLEQQIPATLEVGTAVLTRAQGAAMGEDLRLYADPSTAQQLVALARAGLDCRHGQLRLTGAPETVTFGKVQDVTSAVNADEAIAVQATSARYGILLVAARLGRLVVLFNFLRTLSTPSAALPNPIGIVAKGVAKIRNS